MSSTAECGAKCLRANTSYTRDTLIRGNIIDKAEGYQRTSVASLSLIARVGLLPQLGQTLKAAWCFLSSPRKVLGKSFNRSFYAIARESLNHR